MATFRVIVRYLSAHKKGCALACKSQILTGYASKGSTGVKATLTLPTFEQRFRAWLLEGYHTRVHVETRVPPQERWEAGGFVPRTLKSLEQLDLLLLTVAKTRRVQQDGICLQGYRYIDPTLAGYVKQGCRTVFYTPPVSASVARIEKEVQTVFAAFSYLVEAANQHHQGKEEFLVTRRFSHVIELLIVDEANRCIHQASAGSIFAPALSRFQRYRGNQRRDIDVALLLR